MDPKERSDNKKIGYASLKVANSVILLISLLLSSTLIGDLLQLFLESEADASTVPDIPIEIFLVSAGVYFLMGINEVFRFFIIKKKQAVDKRQRVAHLGYALLCAASLILSLVAIRYSILIEIAALIYCVMVLSKRVVALVFGKKSFRGILASAVLMIIYVFEISVIIGSFDGDNQLFVLSILIISFFFLMSSLWGIIYVAVSNLNLSVLRKIIRKTYAEEIILGLLLLIIAFSIVLPRFESGISSYPDAIWYCFMIITTIGFGDITATSLVGRTLSIILGIYGIVVVAVITSIIVNFYMEVKDANDDKSAEAPEGTSEPKKDDEKSDDQP